MADQPLAGYFDYNATTPISEAVAEKMLASLTLFCNASSSSSSAQQGKEILENGRYSVAKLLDCDPERIAFTSGGSEANNWAVKGTLFNHIANPGHVITSAIEHPSILAAVKYMSDYFGFDVTYIEPKVDGAITTSDVELALRPTTQLVSVMFANNETGVIQPIEQIANLAKSYGATVHSDCVQIVGKRNISVHDLNVDLASFSAHKFYGPKGIGGLYIRDPAGLQPLIHGGGQEMGLRAGTENLLAIAGMAQAAFDASDNVEKWDRQYKDAKKLLIQELEGSELDILFNGSVEEDLSVANTLNFSICGVRGEAIAAFLDKKHGIVVSVGSACSNNDKEKKLSHVLKSMRLQEDQIQSALRVSIGRYTTKEDIHRFVDSLVWCAKKLLEIARV